MLRWALGVGVLAVGVGCSPPRDAPRAAPPQTQSLEFEATAYSVAGTTAGGVRPRAGIVAADPAVLPLGSHIRVRSAGAYSGDYKVGDTGREVSGRRIDIFIADAVEARYFGRRRIQVDILDR